MKIDKNDNLTDLVDWMDSDESTGDTKDTSEGEALTEDGEVMKLGNPKRTHSQISEDMHELENKLNKYFKKNWGKTIVVPSKDN